MLTTEAKERLAGDVALWHADGVIDAATLKTLQERYDTPGFGFMTLIKYAGISGGVLALLGLLGLVTALADSEVLAALILAGLGAALATSGAMLGRDSRARYTYSSRVVLALGVVAWAAGVGVGAHALGCEDPTIAFIMGLGVVPAVFFLAYREQNGFLLFLGLLAVLHWIGSWSRLVGRSSYEFAIDEPRFMAPAALLVFLAGVWHEGRGRPPRFHLVYQTLGLLYLDLSLLFVSIYPYESRGFGIALVTVAALGQIVLGARLKNPLVMGFGVTALALDLFTRYFESMWDEVDRGLFFIVGGLLLVMFAATVERAWRRWGAR